MTTSLQPVRPSEEGISRTFRRGTTPVFQKKEQAARSRTVRVLDCRASGATFGLLFMKALNYSVVWGLCGGKVGTLGTGAWTLIIHLLDNFG